MFHCLWNENLQGRKKEEVSVWGTTVASLAQLWGIYTVGHLPKRLGWHPGRSSPSGDAWGAGMRSPETASARDHWQYFQVGNLEVLLRVRRDKLTHSLQLKCQGTWLYWDMAGHCPHPEGRFTMSLALYNSTILPCTQQLKDFLSFLFS